MRTISKVHTPEQRREMRIRGENRAKLCMIRLIAVVSILRTSLTQLLPLAGSAGWWVVPLCLLPGLAVYSLLTWAMKRTGTTVLSDCLRALFGAAGAWILSIVFTLLLAVDGASSMTALITLFTEGIGTEGTQFTLALLTTGVLVFCLHRDGLPRGVYMLKWVMLLAAAVLATDALMNMKADHLFPLLGNGRQTVWAVLMLGISLGWPLTLLLTAEPVNRKRRWSSILPVVGLCVAAVVIICLSMPHERLTEYHDLSRSMLEMTLHLHPAVKTLGLCLLMLVLFLSIAASALLLTQAVSAPLGREPGWLTYAVIVILALTQTLNIRQLWQWLSVMQNWLLAPLAVIAVAVLPAALIRRKRI